MFDAIDAHCASSTACPACCLCCPCLCLVPQPIFHSCCLVPRSTHTSLCSCTGRQQQKRSLEPLEATRSVQSPPWTALDRCVHTAPPITFTHRPRRPLAVHAAEPGRPAAPALQHAALLAGAVPAGAQGLGAVHVGRGSVLAWGLRRLLPADRQPRGWLGVAQAASSSASLWPHLAASAPACLPPFLAAAAWSSAATLPWPL